MPHTQTPSSETPYDNLSPERVMQAIEAHMGACSGGLFALNSYENRVYDVALEEGGHVVVKFYRPHRWSRAQIMEEHAFAAELEAVEFPIVAPLAFEGKTLFDDGSYMYALYPKRGGRPFEVREDEDLRQMGRLIGRLHNIGAQEAFTHRLNLSPQTMGWDNATFLQESGMVPDDLKEAWHSTAKVLLERIDAIWQSCPFTPMRLHGDCHLGNILVGVDGPFLVDLDDSMNGPAVQDLWMLLSGDMQDMSHQLGVLLEGYTQFREFDFGQLRLVEALRTLRQIHYAAWLARRWHDPTFPRSFPFFGTQNFWQQHILDLKEQMARLDEPLLISF